MARALIFDLDGTLLDTLTDIRSAINEALKACSFDIQYSLSECRSLIGNGADALVHRALGNFDSQENFEKLKKAYMPLYEAYQGRHTKPFNGIPTVLKFLKDKDVLLFVCTNKPDALAKEIISSRFGDDLFKEVYGHREGSPVKPDPLIVNHFLLAYGLEKNETIFVGDSLPDLLTAQNAGIRCGICTWGYGFYKPSLLNECDFVFKKAKDLAVLANE